MADKESYEKVLEDRIALIEERLGIDHGCMSVCGTSQEKTIPEQIYRKMDDKVGIDSDGNVVDYNYGSVIDIDLRDLLTIVLKRGGIRLIPSELKGGV